MYTFVDNATLYSSSLLTWFPNGYRVEFVVKFADPYHTWSCLVHHDLRLLQALAHVSYTECKVQVEEEIIFFKKKPLTFPGAHAGKIAILYIS